MGLIHLISSPKTTMVLLLLYAIGLGGATFIENASSTEIAKLFIYNSPIFFLLQLLLCFNFIGMIWLYDYVKRRKWAMILFHSAFIVILAGAMTTYLLGEEGVLHIREGESSNTMIVNRSTPRSLPFTVTLKEFRLVRYPGSNSPSSYESDIEVEYKGTRTNQMVFMNNVVMVGSYRLYQSSFDKDEKGTILSVSNDPVGMFISYLGYILLIGGMIATLFSPHSRFRMLAQRLKNLSSASVAIVLLSTLSPTITATALPVKSPSSAEVAMIMPPKEHALRFGRILVQNPKGRTEPMDTYARELLRKLYREESFSGYSSTQFLLATLSQPYTVSRLPLLYVDNIAVAERFGATGNYLTYNQLFDTKGNYTLTNEIQEIYAKEPKERTQSDKALLKIDEKVNILYSLFHHTLLPLMPLPGATTHKWYSPGDDLSAFTGKDSLFVSRIFPWYLTEVNDARQNNTWAKADEVLEMIATYQQAKSPLAKITNEKADWELLYNRLDIFKWSFRFYLAFGFLLLLLLLLRVITKSTTTKLLSTIATAALVATFLFQTFGLGLRWIISGHAPFSNAYESMVFVGWSALFAGLFFIRRSPIAFSVAAILAGFVLLVSELNFMDPEITPLVPVLKSYWLMIHVAVIMSSYGFFGMGAFVGLLNMILTILRGKSNRTAISRHIEELTIVNEMALIAGLILMTAGTFLGAVWANESWGRYWGWDPKETWALVTMIVYAMVLHARFVPKLKGTFIFNLLSILALSSVLMTYFGVNYYLSGLHSYGRSEGLPIQIIQYGSIIVFLVVTAAALRNYSQRFKT